MTIRRLVVAALAVGATLFPTIAGAQEEAPPVPSPTPAIAPIPTYPEKRPGVSPAADLPPAPRPVRVDSAGMFGVGFMIGNTSTGANAKMWFADDLALQFSAGAGPLGNNLRFQLDLLYTFHRWDAEDGLYSLPFYAGAGAQAGVYMKYPWPDERTDLGVRIPVGMGIVIPNNPVEIFFEVAPDVAIYHDEFDDKDHAVFFVDGQIGVRYYF